jgi:hypothetical protein
MIRAAVVLLVLLLALATSAEEWSPPQMAWGDPDLQGTWTNATITGLERPDEVEALVVSAEEARRIEKLVADLYASVDDVPEGELEVGEDVGGYNTFWMDPGKRLAAVRGEIRTSIITDPPDGKLPYSLRGRAQRLKRFWQLRKADDPETRLLGERCLVGFGSTGGPPMLPVLYNNHYQVVQSPGFVVILVEMNHNARIIRLDAAHRKGPIRPWLGDSVGRFDGQTLVVETTNFHPAQSFRVSLTHSVYMSKDAKVVERFTRVGAKEILYEFAVDDLENYKQVWRGEMPLLAAEGRIYEYACHEGNYSLTNILAGERAKD